jgi:hypothetical protein
MLIVIGLIVLAGLLLAVLPVSAQSVSYVTYVVQPNDSLSKIAAEYCTTWQEIYNLNYAVIGSNPNILTPGTVLTVPNRCGTGTVPPGCTVYDRGPSQYAQGSVSGNVYTVAYGDTWCIPNGWDGYQAPPIISFFEDFGEHGVLENVCIADYGPIFQESVDLVIDSCEGFVPQG